MKKVSGPQVDTPAEERESSSPAEIQEALSELVGAAREGLLRVPWRASAALRLG
jgi:hypothetical protein